MDTIHALADYDIACIQECWGGIHSDIREMFTQMAIKAGFLYICEDGAPAFSTTYICDGGTMILSRFPIVAKSH